MLKIRLLTHSPAIDLLTVMTFESNANGDSGGKVEIIIPKKQIPSILYYLNTPHRTLVSQWKTLSWVLKTQTSRKALACYDEGCSVVCHDALHTRLCVICDDSTSIKVNMCNYESELKWWDINTSRDQKQVKRKNQN